MECFVRVCLREKDICIYELNRYMYSNKLPINKAVGVLLFFFFPKRIFSHSTNRYFIDLLESLLV